MGQKRVPSSTPIIRTAGQDDAALLSDLIRQSYSDVALRFGLTPANCPAHPSNCTASWVQHDLSRGVTYYILETKGVPVGCAALELAEQDLAYLERLSVLPPYRRNGFGRRLAEHVIAAARRRGAGQVGIGIIADQIELKQWYRRIGFVHGETRTFEHLPFAVCLMSFDLQADL
jgi:GNAT superfamily N-acetyltransferase